MTIVRTLILATLVASPSVVGAQSSTATGSIGGDVYLTMQSGDVRKGAGRTIYLLADTPLLHAGRDSICVHYTFDHLPVLAMRSAVMDSMLGNAKGKLAQHLVDRDMSLSAQLDTLNSAMHAQVDHLIVQSIRDTTGTGMNAHYRFENEPPGSYIVYATWKIGDNDYTWWHPVEVRAGQTVKRDLDNSGAGSAIDYLVYGGSDTMASRLYCVGPRITVMSH